MQTLIPLALCIAAVVAIRTARHASWVPPFATGCAVLGLVSASWMFARSGESATGPAGWHDRETTLAAEGYVLGRHLVDHYPGRKVVVLPPLPLVADVPLAPRHGVDALVGEAKGKLDLKLAELDVAIPREDRTPTADPIPYENGTAVRITPEEIRRFMGRCTDGVEVLVVAFNHEAYLREWETFGAASRPALVLLHAPHDPLAGLFQRKLIQAASVYAPTPEARSRAEHASSGTARRDLARSLFTVATPQNYLETLKN